MAPDPASRCGRSGAQTRIGPGERCRCRCVDASGGGTVQPPTRTSFGFWQHDTYAIMTRFLSDKMGQWDNLRDAQGRRLVDVVRLDDRRPLKEVEREMETIQERFNRLMDKRHAEGLTEGQIEGRAAGRAEGQIEGVLVSFRRTLADSGLDHRLAAEVEAHADRIVEAARRGVRFDLEDIPDAARLIAAIRDGGGPTRVSAERIWALLPHIPEEDAAPE